MKVVNWWKFFDNISLLSALTLTRVPYHLKNSNSQNVYSNFQQSLLQNVTFTLQVGLIMLLTLPIMVQATPQLMYRCVICAIPKGGLLDKSLQEIHKNHDSCKRYQMSTLNLTYTKIIKHKKLYKLHKKNIKRKSANT